MIGDQLRFVALDAPADFVYARSQMALSLGWHIVMACFGVAFPAMVLFAEWRGHAGDRDMARLAHTWAKAIGVLFAVGAVSGTILSFEMGMLWPGLMSRFGEIYGFPFTLEGFAFFLEAIFVGIYLFGWDRLSPRAHMLSGRADHAVRRRRRVLRGRRERLDEHTRPGSGWRRGRWSTPNRWPRCSTPPPRPRTVHMLLGAVLVVGFSVASVYAVGMLRGRRDRYHRLGLLMPLTVAAIAAPVQIVVGDWIANVVAEHQPVKLAAMEGITQTSRGVPLSIGGIYVDNELRYADRDPARAVAAGPSRPQRRW